MTQRISLWSGPRNVSTALMYSFAQRADTQVVDEPFYGYYLRVSGADHPGTAEVMAAMECDGERVVQTVILGHSPKPVLFFKNMAHHLVGLDLGFFNQLTHVLLTRNPEEMLPSLAQNIPQPRLTDTGYEMQVNILHQLLALGQLPPVIEARELLLNPAAILRQLCARLELPFDEAMLQWQAGARPEDGVWAPYWYENVHRSTTFAPYKPKTEPFPDALRPLLAECQPLYEQLLKYALKA